MYLHTLFLTRGRLESTWTVLKLFGKFFMPRGGWHITAFGHGFGQLAAALLAHEGTMTFMVAQWVAAAFPQSE